MYNRRIALSVVCVATLVLVACPGTSAGIFDSRNYFRSYFGDDASLYQRELGDQCPQDFLRDYDKNVDICNRCTDYYKDERMGNLCRQNCFTSCYYVRCKNLVECHWGGS